MALWKGKRILWRLLNYSVRFSRLQSTKVIHTMMSFTWEDGSQTISICKMGHKVGVSEDKQNTLLLALLCLSLTSLVSNHYFSFFIEAYLKHYLSSWCTVRSRSYLEIVLHFYCLACYWYQVGRPSIFSAMIQNIFYFSFLHIQKLTPGKN